MSTQRVNRTSRVFPALLVGGLFSVAASGMAAQLPEGTSAEHPNKMTAEDLTRTGVFAQSHGIARKDGRVLGAGSDYEARFEPGTFSFTPALGANAPQTMPVNFNLQEVRRGSTIVLSADPSTPPTTDGGLVVYHRKAGIDERYEVLPEGVHQTFLFDSLPAGEGDLIVRGRIDSLYGTPSVDATGITFEVPGLGGVHWGEVTGIDADGAMAEGEIRMDGDIMELVLPGDFVENASFPLLLDPIVGSLTVNGSGDDDNNPDVAYDVSSGHYLVVWRRAFALDHSHVRGQLVTSNGALEGGVLFLSEGTGIIAGNPAVANVNSQNRFVVVWEQAPNTFSNYNIMAMSVHAETGAESGIVSVATSPNQQLRPAVGGDRLMDDNDALVVWQETGVGLRMREIAIFGAADPIPVGFGSTALENNDGTAKVNAAISRSAGDAGRYLVVWESFSGGTGTIDGQIVDRDMNLIGPDVNISAGPASLDQTLPSVDGNGDRWIVAWQREEAAATGMYDIYTRPVVFDGGGIGFDAFSVPFEADEDDQETEPAVAWTGSSAFVAFIDVNATRNVYAKSADPFTGLVCEDDMEVFVTSDIDGVVAAGADWAGGEGFNIDDVLIVWDSRPNQGADRDILGARYDAPDFPTDLGGDCGMGGMNYNPCAIDGNQNFTVQLRGAEPSAPTFFLVSTGTNPLPCGSCTLIPALDDSLMIYNGFTDGEGNASFGIPIPNGVDGSIVYSQWATRIAGGPCPVLDGFVLSNALETEVNP